MLQPGRSVYLSELRLTNKLQHIVYPLGLQQKIIQHVET